MMAEFVQVLLLFACVAVVCSLNATAREDSSRAGPAIVAGHLFSISRSLEIDVFEVDSDAISELYSAHTVSTLSPDNQVHLRDPCSPCDPSYNQFRFGVNQTIIANSDQLYAITVLNDVPYFQILSSQGCIPLNIFKPSRFYGVLYILCRNTRNYFLARLTQESTDLQWSYETLPNFDDFTSEGTFSEYYDPDFDIYFVYYVYERNDLLVFEGPDNNYIRFFALPDDCANVIRITAIPNNRYHVLIECANQTNSDNITSVHVFDPDSGHFVRVLQNVSYSKCPIQFADRGSILVLFAQRQILIKSLTEGSFTEVDTAGLVYDGQLTEIDGEIFAVYSTVNGLFRLNISDSQGIMKFEDLEGICAHSGCPLLKFLTPNNFIATVGDKMALCSVHPPRILITVPTDFSPARLIFERHSPLLPSPSPTNPYEHTSAVHQYPIDQSSVSATTTTTSSVTESPRVDLNVNFDKKTRMSPGGIAGIIIAASVIAVSVVVVVVVVIVLKLRNQHGHQPDQRIPLVNWHNCDVGGIQPGADAEHVQAHTVEPDNDDALNPNHIVPGSYPPHQRGTNV